MSGASVPPHLRAAITAADQMVTRERLTELCAQLVEIPSPTGREAALATRIAAVLRAAGGHGEVQHIDDLQANAFGWTGAGRPDGRRIMLYSPIDTVTSGHADDDLPWAGEPRAPELAPHQVPAASVDGDLVSGLGAMNPKGHAACVLMAFEAIAAVVPDLPGQVIAAFGAGGMPTFADGGDPLHRAHTGHGVGCSFLIERGVWADAAVIAKSGWGVSHDEVGLAWCDVTVHGDHTYVGARHRLPYRSAIADAALVGRHLEQWFVDRAEQHRTATLLPQAVVASFTTANERSAAFTPASARLRVDLRIGHDQSPLDALRELQRELDRLSSEHPGLDLTTRLVAAIPSSATRPDHWVCAATVDAWEDVTGSPHRTPQQQSGATDANILRQRGIPTARVGLPKVVDAGGELGFSAGMNTVSVTSMVDLTRVLLRVAITGAGERLPDDGAV
jgi:acetylornithine deacetylase/succinyl-diaminopimelate desuccinylase-like protein